MEHPTGGELPPEIDPWEMDLIGAFSKRERLPPAEKEELEAELCHKWLVFRRRNRTDIRDLKAFLKGFLRHKISDWHRDRKRREETEVSLHQPVADDPENVLTLESTLESIEPDLDRQLDSRRILEKLNPSARAAVLAVFEAKGNISLAARRLHCHRNTLGRFLRRLRQAIKSGVLKFPSFEAVRSRKGRTTSPRRISSRILTLPVRFLELLSMARLRGPECRILLWVYSETERRKKRTVPFSWSQIGKYLAIHRSHVHRVALRLLRGHWLHIDGAKIGCGARCRPAKAAKSGMRR